MKKIQEYDIVAINIGYKLMYLELQSTNYFARWVITKSILTIKFYDHVK